MQVTKRPLWQDKNGKTHTGRPTGTDSRDYTVTKKRPSLITRCVRQSGFHNPLRRLVAMSMQSCWLLREGNILET
jgi:hypothetical protein